MRRILYIGNKLEKHGAAPTSIDTLPLLLKSEGLYFRAVSSVRSKVFRLIHMLWVTLVNYKKKDLVLIDTYSTWNFWFAVSCGWLCRTLSVPYIFILHGGNLESRFNNSSENHLKIFRSARANVVPSGFLKEKLEKFNFNNLKVIPNNIDLNSYDFKKRNSLKPKLLWVRAFDKVYNPEMALEVVKLLIKEYPNVELCMVGPEKDGSLAKLKKKVKKENLPIIFTGKLNKDEWLELSKDYEIFINTTKIDNTPVSVIEAMALGFPVISTKVGGIPFLIEHRQNGLLVESNNPEAMAKAVNALLTDPELSENLSLHAKERVKLFDWDHVKPLWLELLG